MKQTKIQIKLSIMFSGKITNGDILVLEQVLYYQMNSFPVDEPGVVKLKDIEHFKLQYCIDRNIDRVKAEAKRIRDAIEKSQTKIHRKLIEDFSKAFQQSQLSDKELKEDDFLKTWEKGDELRKEKEKFSPKNDSILAEESGIEFYKIPANSLDDDLPISGNVYQLVKLFLSE